MEAGLDGVLDKFWGGIIAASAPTTQHPVYNIIKYYII
jgi:hypothetical protein